MANKKEQPSKQNDYYKRNSSFNENTRKWRANFLNELQKDSNQVQIKKLKAFFPPIA